MVKLSKKGEIQSSLWTLISIILVGLLIFSMVVYINDIRQNTYFKRDVLSKDLAMLMNTVQALPGNIYFNYMYESGVHSDFNYTFRDNEVIVKDLILPRTSSFAYYDNLHIENNYVEESIGKPLSIEFRKVRDSLFVNEGLSDITGVSNCAPVGDDIVQPNNRLLKIFSVDEDSILSDAFYDYMTSLSINKGPIPPYVKSEKVTKASEDSYSLLIGVNERISKTRSDKSVLVYDLYPNAFSRQLRCHIYNKLAESKKFSEVSTFMFTSQGYIDEDILKTYKASLLIMVFVKDDPDDDDSRLLASYLSNSVRSAIKEFEDGEAR